VGEKGIVLLLLSTKREKRRKGLGIYVSGIGIISNKDKMRRVVEKKKGGEKKGRSKTFNSTLGKGGGATVSPCLYAFCKKKGKGGKGGSWCPKWEGK